MPLQQGLIIVALLSKREYAVHGPVKAPPTRWPYELGTPSALVTLAGFFWPTTIESCQGSASVLRRGACLHVVLLASLQQYLHHAPAAQLVSHKNLATECGFLQWFCSQLIRRRLTQSRYQGRCSGAAATPSTCFTRPGQPNTMSC